MKFKMQMMEKLHERLKILNGPGNFRYFFLVSCFLLAVSFVSHPYYVSVTEMEYRPKQKEIQIACKIFADDLEDALKIETGKKINLMDEKQKAANQAIINSYLQKHIRFQVSGKQVTYEMLGFEIEQEAIWNYLVVKNVEKPKEVTVFNDVLYSLRQGQINILHFKNNGTTQSYRLNAPEQQHRFQWTD